MKRNSLKLNAGELNIGKTIISREQLDSWEFNVLNYTYGLCYLRLVFCFENCYSEWKKNFLNFQTFWDEGLSETCWNFIEVFSVTYLLGACMVLRFIF